MINFDARIDEYEATNIRLMLIVINNPVLCELPVYIVENNLWKDIVIFKLL